MEEAKDRKAWNSSSRSFSFWGAIEVCKDFWSYLSVSFPTPKPVSMSGRGWGMVNGPQKWRVSRKHVILMQTKGLKYRGSRDYGDGSVSKDGS